MPDQLDLLTLIPRPPKALAKSGDPATSHEAAAVVEATSAPSRRLAYLRLLGERYATVDYIAHRANLPRNEVAKRITDLRNEGLVKPARDVKGEDMTIKGSSGRRVIVWRITDKGRLLLRGQA